MGKADIHSSLTGLPEASASFIPLPAYASSHTEPINHMENHANRKGISLESHVRLENLFFPVAPENAELLM